MRGMTGLLWETSLLDPDEVWININQSIIINYSISLILNNLITAGALLIKDERKIIKTRKLM